MTKRVTVVVEFGEILNENLGIDKLCQVHHFLDSA